MPDTLAVRLPGERSSEEASVTLHREKLVRAQLTAMPWIVTDRPAATKSLGCTRQSTVEISCCANKREMRKRLRKIAEMPTIGT
jgi:hypothetical protein